MKPPTWEIRKVSEIVSSERNSIVGGPFGSDLVSKDYVPVGVPVIRGANMGSGRWVSGEFVFVTEAKADALAANCAKPGDLVFTQRGTIGQVALVPSEGFSRYLLSQSQMKLTADTKKADVLFLFYTFSGSEQQKYIQQNAIRTGVPHTNLAILRDTPILLPPLAQQNEIASIADALDAKIELNNQINAELEAMAKLLYDYWFVQFDFPMTAAQAAALGRPELEGKPYRSSGGKMVHNPTLKREIPGGWSAGTLLDIANYSNGIACQKFRPNSADRLPVIKIKEMRDGFTDATEFVRPNIPEKVKVRDGDVLFSWSASLEVILWTGGPGALNQHIFKVTSHTHPRSFFYHELRNYLSHFKMLADLRKTTMGHITQEHLEQSRISIPSDDVVTKFDSLVDPLLKTIILHQKQSQELAQLRDWLLPMLMNGQVTVG